MMMPNIPRRKIYEEMLKLEDIILEINILLISKENFLKFKFKFNNRINELKKIFIKLKILLILFLENKKFENEIEFEKYSNYLLDNENYVNNIIMNNKNLKKSFKKIIFDLDAELKSLNSNYNFKEIKELYEILDEFNSIIPKILELRRDKMR